LFDRVLQYLSGWFKTTRHHHAWGGWYFAPPNQPWGWCLGAFVGLCCLSRAFHCMNLLILNEKQPYILLPSWQLPESTSEAQLIISFV